MIALRPLAALSRIQALTNCPAIVCHLDRVLITLQNNFSEDMKRWHWVMQETCIKSNSECVQLSWPDERTTAVILLYHNGIKIVDGYYGGSRIYARSIIEIDHETTLESYVERVFDYQVHLSGRSQRLEFLRVAKYIRE